MLQIKVAHIIGSNTYPKHRLSVVIRKLANLAPKKLNMRILKIASNPHFVPAFQKKSKKKEVKKTC